MKNISFKYIVPMEENSIYNLKGESKMLSIYHMDSYYKSKLQPTTKIQRNHKEPAYYQPTPNSPSKPKSHHLNQNALILKMLNASTASKMIKKKLLSRDQES